MDFLKSMGLGAAHAEEGRMHFAIYQDAQPSTGAELQALVTACMARVLPHLQGYIWQHERFNLHSSLQEPPPWTKQQKRGQKVQGAEPPCVWGTLRFGDNIEDEWFAVWLLLELTRQLPDISVRMWDEDGEFLLIEAAVNALPRWLSSPEKAANRVWLRGGHMHVIPPPSSKAPTLPEQPTLAEALQVLRSGVINTHRPKVEAPVLERVAGYPAAAHANMLTVHCALPLRAAHVLRQEPELVAPAVEAFYLRDPDDVKLASAMRHFPPSEGMVRSAVIVSRIMYSQLRMQQHTGPRAYPMPLPSDPDFTAADLGMKITTGIEVVVARGQQEEQQQQSTPSWQPDATPSAAADQQSRRSSSGHGAVTEQQLASSPAWAAYLRALEQKDYFQGNIAGSKAYKERMAAAVSAFVATDAYAQSSAALAAPAARVAAVLEAAPLPAGGAAAWQEAVGQLPPETSHADLEQQLDEQLERQMAKREAEQARYEAAQQQRHSGSGAAGPSNAAAAGAAGGGFGDGSGMSGDGSTAGPSTAGQSAADAAEFVRAMRGFMAHSAGYEGAEVPSTNSAGHATGAVSMDDSMLWHTLFGELGIQSSEVAGDNAQLKAVLKRLSALAGGGDSDEDEDDGSSTEGSSFFGSDAGSNSGSGSESDMEQDVQQWPRGSQPGPAGGNGAHAAASSGATAHGSATQAQAAHVAAAVASKEAPPAATRAAGTSGRLTAESLQQAGSGDAGTDMEWMATGHEDSDAASLHVSDLSIDESEHDDLSIGGEDFDSDHAASDEAFHAAYSQVLTEQLASTKLAETFQRAPAPAAGPSTLAAAGPSNSAAGPAELLPVDIDMNLVSNMLRSFESQEGLPGPASNLAGLLGLNLRQPKQAGTSS